jgi:hydroxymethylbilane synthase
MHRIKIGTRESALALSQTNWVKSKLERLFPECRFETIHIKTQGDRVSDVPLERIAGEGVFVKQIELALVNGEIDLAIHSMKDVPTILPDGLSIGAVPKRFDPSDALISKHNLDFQHLPAQAKIGTGSLRRRAQLLYARRDLVIRSIRGNVDTRLRKLMEQDLDAIVLAVAGMERLGRHRQITQRLPYHISLPAVGQGALCVQIRADDQHMRLMVRSIDHPESSSAVRAERAFLRKLGGGCRVPIAALGLVNSGQLELTGMVTDRYGKRLIRSSVSGRQDEAEYMGEELAEALFGMGAKELLSENLS